MPALGLGTWLSKKGEVRAAVREAITAGYRHIDTAWYGGQTCPGGACRRSIALAYICYHATVHRRIYRNEAEVGQGIADAIRERRVVREDLFIVGKLWNTFHQDVERYRSEGSMWRTAHCQPGPRAMC